MTVGSEGTHGQRIGAFGAALDLEAIPSDVIDKIKLHLLDVIGVAYAFSRDPLAKQLAAMATRGHPTGRATIIGFSQRASAREAAFANGAFGHGLDFDDVHVASITHPTVVVAPAVFALAEAERQSGRAVLVATALGIEVCARLGRSGGPAMAKRGIPPMSTCGALAAAAAAAKVLGLQAHAIAAAIGVAGSFACGSHEWTTAGTNSKFTTAGWAARSGVIAARMAQGGFDGSMSAIEGHKGLLVSMAGPDNFDRVEPSACLGDRWETRNVMLKRFASCQGTQPYIAAALTLSRNHALNPAHIAQVDVTVGAGVGTSLSEPYGMKRSPPNAYAAKFSIPFCVALALTEGEVRLAHFGEAWPIARRVSKLAAKVRHSIDPNFDIGAAERGRVRVTLTDGRTFEAENDSAEDSLTVGEVTAKFTDCTAELLSTAHQTLIIDAFLDLEHISDMSSVMALLAPTGLPDTRTDPSNISGYRHPSVMGP